MARALPHLAPQLALLGGAVVTLLFALFAPRERQRWNAPLALAALAASAAMQLDLLRSPATLTFDRLWALDGATSVASLVILGTTAVVVVLTPRWLATDRRHGEYYPMLLLGALGAVAMAAATDLNLLLVAVTLSSVTGYVLAAYHRASPLSAEAGIKYFLVGAMANLVLLIGVVLVFTAGATTHHPALRPALSGADAWLLVPAAAALVVGLAFKAGAVPAHSWVPDVAQGAPLPSAAFLTVAPKVGGLIALARIVTLLPEHTSGWRPTVAVVAAATMTLGNLAALRQDDVRRLLGWSSVSQAGYALMAVAAVGASDLAVPSLLLFLAAYAAANVGAFAAVGALRGRTRLDDYEGLGRERPVLATVLVVCLLSLVGIPPLAGFGGKLAVFTATIDAGLAWLAVLAVLNTVLSLAYYLRVLAPVVRGEGGPQFHLLGRAARWAAVAAAAGVVLLGVAGDAVLDALRGVLLPG